MAVEAVGMMIWESLVDSGGLVAMDGPLRLWMILARALPRQPALRDRGLSESDNCLTL